MSDHNMLDKENNFDIAIIGMSVRVPGADSIDKFWQNLREGVESISKFTDEELMTRGVPPAVYNDPNYVKAGSFLDDVEMFDASLFGFSPYEAKLIDPQHRIFLESAWESLETAGYNPETYKGLIGVFAGASMNDYLFNVYANQKSNDVAGAFQKLISIDKDYLTTRVSYKLNLRGPSFTIQTACSTSLVAVHLACQNLLSYQCDMALAGGVCINLPRKIGYLYQEGMIFSPDGHCRAFDKKAKGTFGGEGVGIVVLKRLSEALEDGDNIQAVIKGSAINNDGALKVGYTAPGVDGQTEVIAAAQAFSQIDPETISYIEAHGTGTPLGDPIEIEALTQAFRARSKKNGFCAVGSVKTNIGHLDAAAGVAGLIKTVLALQHKEIPPSLNFETPNPKINFENSPFYVNTRLKNWQSNGMPRRAGVSSFGIGGTNAHVILEESPEITASGSFRPWKLLLLSGNTKTALDTVTTNLAKHLKQQSSVNLADVAYTLQNGRKALNHRRMIVCRDINDAVNILESHDPKRVKTSFQEPITRDIVFMFSGQGSQYVNMGLELYKTEPEFRKHIDLCSEIFKPHLSFDLRDILYPDRENAEEAEQKLKQTSITQPALFAIEYALAKLWMAWGVHPTALIGHSSGEYVAACLAGVFSLEDALSLIAARGRLMQALPRGSMLAVFLSEENIRPLLYGDISLSAVNSPSVCTVSGPDEAVKEFEKQLADREIVFRDLNTSHAFHSKMMEPILNPFTEELRQVKLNPPQIPFISNVTGTWITPEEAQSPDYWALHFRNTVRFSNGIQELLKEPDRVLLEVGPGNTLRTLSLQQKDISENRIILSSIRHPKEQRSDTEFILNIIGRLWLSGVQINWKEFYADEKRYRVPLPTYPFERKRYWVDTKKQVRVPCFPEVDVTVEQKESSISGPACAEEKDHVQFHYTSGNSVEQSLAHIWQELLGVEQVRVNDNFFDLGGSSLIAVSLFTYIEKTFGRRLPLATLYRAPTIAELSKTLLEGKFAKPWSSLVEIKPGKSDMLPFFFIHAAGGNVLNYYDLAHSLDEGLPVYGMQAQGLDNERPFHNSIEDMASHYVHEMLEFQKHGPYLLGGYCMGGTIALEMAQQLRKHGHEVALLAFFETHNWAKMPSMSLPDKIFFYSQKLDFHLRNILLLDSREKSKFFMEKARELRRRSKLWYGKIVSRVSGNDGNGTDQHSLLAQLWDNNDRAAFNYVPEYYPGKITLFMPMKKYVIHNRPEMGWDQLAEEVETHDLPVYPAGMLVEPFVKILAERLKVCINEALETKLTSKI